MKKSPSSLRCGIVLAAGEGKRLQPLIRRLRGDSLPKQYVTLVGKGAVGVDARTGKLLWQYKLDAGGYATPRTYSVKGRQYVAIAAGGGGKLGTKSGDCFVAFALPDH